MTTAQKPTTKEFPPLWKQFSNFTNTHPLGIEKTLRFIQAVVTILSSSIFVSYIPNSVYAVKCASAKNQIALARRYLRFFKFIDCFDAGYTAWLVPAPLESDAVRKIASVGKWSFLGVYFFLEDLTILDAMGIWVTPWAQELFIECHKWWFFGLALSIIGSTVDIFLPVSEPTLTSSAVKQSEKKTVTSEKEKKKQPLPVKRDLTPLVKGLIVDSCDIVIPGSVLGWIPASSTQVGLMMVVSTLVSSGGIWAQVNK
ncbi:PEX11 domain protein [Talaromyces stipitatus ATCC 10500]|uniref:PEX11 domain protein n=1 Tax=Talaromyces stipitatus (strain ATCC 10500 / CBS 375.48 / QM 6759 / NRRL 1006) TaxID=441959 RepID=B8LZ32_TALSN|nr:PEX11 domain protein [Talaromyces stipitatus ATCC 10500]EED21076.1 PEX11 domain protein [Talaromyces stipitatus ATCC 10500]